MILALSADSLVVGTAYSSGRLVIPRAAYFAIGLCTSFMMFVPMLLGYIGFLWFPYELSRIIGGTILIFLGVYHLFRVYLENKRSAGEENTQAVLLKLRVKTLGIIIEILKEPLKVDMDSSGHIDLKEALSLGLALGIDSLGAGFAVSLTGFSFWIVPCAGFFSALFVWAGANISFPASVKRVKYLPGILLGLLGLSKIILRTR